MNAPSRPSPSEIVASGARAAKRPSGVVAAVVLAGAAVAGVSAVVHPGAPELVGLNSQRTPTSPYGTLAPTPGSVGTYGAPAPGGSATPAGYGAMGGTSYPTTGLGIPAPVLAAYQNAAARSASSTPGCHMSWPILAGVGRIESGHAQGGRVDTAGRTLGRIVGVPLDGSPGVAQVRDTDSGALDGDTVWDRAVGPMQFIPSTWRNSGVDGNNDGTADPNNVFDAATTAAEYLCARGNDVATPAGFSAAVLRYNNSPEYRDNVLSWARAYAAGAVVTAPSPGPVTSAPVPPPSSPGQLTPPPPVAPPAAAGPTAAPSPTPAPQAGRSPATGPTSGYPYPSTAPGTPLVGVGSAGSPAFTDPYGQYSPNAPYPGYAPYSPYPPSAPYSPNVPYAPYPPNSAYPQGPGYAPAPTGSSRPDGLFPSPLQLSAEVPLP